MRIKKASMMAMAMALAAGLAVAACQPAAPPAPKAEEPKVVAAAAPTPPESLAREFSATCTWGEVKGGGASIYAYACPDRKVVFDASIPGFAVETTGPNASKAPIVRLFTKAADAPVDSILPALQAADAETKSCALQAMKDSPGDFELVPVGAQARAYEAFRNGNAEGPDMPCGAMGPSEGGSRVFSAVPGAPTLVSVIFFPSDIPTFDAKTLKGAL